ncbi:MAG: SDR family oxidoreductase [Nanoarchaeota archaeon]|nr:SDR family oxidoreductase [Nanoarchaeota archaeon]
MSLKGKTGILFGAGAIASGYVQLFADEDMNLVLVGIDDTAERLAEGISVKDGRKIIHLNSDARDAAKIQEVYDSTAEEFGHIDVVVNGAGGNRPEAMVDGLETFANMDPKVEKWMMDLNYFSKRFSLQSFAKHLMGKDHKGRTVNITSMAGFRSLSKGIDYAAAYSAVERLTKGVAYLFGQEGIGEVNNVAVGFTIGDQNRALLQNADGTPTPRAGEILAYTAGGRFLDVKEIGPHVVYLADASKSEVITGQTLRVDLGYGTVDIAGTAGYRKKNSRKICNEGIKC